MNVKAMIESTILSGDYELGKILSSIDLYHIEGSLTATASLLRAKSMTASPPEGVVCVWSPAEYPTYWKEVV